VHLTGLDGAAGGNERLPRDLPAEDALPVFFGTDAAKDVDLELFEVEQIDQIRKRVRHAPQSIETLARGLGQALRRSVTCCSAAHVGVLRPQGKGTNMARASAKKAHSARGRALVTGASVGIGAAFSERLAHDGHDLIIVARDRQRLESLAERLRDTHRVQVEVLPADLTETAELRVVERLVADADLELLVNNAGFGTVGRFAELDADREEAEIRLNVTALVRLTRAALPSMIERDRGAIINVSSMAGFQPAPYNATYGATKAYVCSFTEALAEELRGSGVRVQTLCPGFTRTEFQERAGVDVSRVPSFAWMTAEAVVDASLAGLARGEVVCVPGITNRLVATLTSAVPRSVTRRIVASLIRPDIGGT
jgi:uncharacterized protein